ncbi:hypothetical protein FC89_GL000002 [Liquorilactobacillus ghanensis DSM 18630]|jgi:hypothetical protein|uniref:HTH crp-type domain-containing protein n=1 Tax=Liquorilactobacillus ghanensis DSM 18630 TaxID=1423750 RepID=A0A0R1VQ53_9LACO|nr:helix-turn-helix domain-containing protein [Liquorilactobacillus ghanensis]KRM07565.1 hypothetical protein FC89_GL000002 [Liquorilactobacillus ghanensis DSM 18630]
MINNTENRLTVEKLEFFNLLDKKMQQEFIKNARLQSFKKGECINNKLDLGKNVIIVLEGKLVCKRFHANGEGYSVFFLKEEEHYPFIDKNLSEYLDVYLIGKTSGKSLILTTEMFEQLRINHVQIDEILLSKINWHFYFAVSMRCVFPVTNACERAKRVIYLFNREFGDRQADGSSFFPRWINHYEIALSAATTRERVSQTISQLRREGMVENRGHLLILKPAFLEQLKQEINLEPHRIT